MSCMKLSPVLVNYTHNIMEILCIPPRIRTKCHVEKQSYINKKNFMYKISNLQLNPQSVYV